MEPLEMALVLNEYKRRRLEAEEKDEKNEDKKPPMVVAKAPPKDKPELKQASLFRLACRMIR